MEKIQHQGAVQGNLRLFPKGIVLRCVLGGRVLDEVIDQTEHIGILSDIPEGIVTVGMARLDQVENPEYIAALQKKGTDAPKKLSLGVRHDKAGISEE